MDNEVQEHNMYTDGEYLVEPEPEGELWCQVVTGLHRAPILDTGEFPYLDNRDEGETWVWIDADTYVTVSLTMARAILASFNQDDEIPRCAHCGFSPCACGDEAYPA